MVEEITTWTEEVKNVYYCDECGIKIEHKRSFNTCYMCKKDICDKCTARWINDDGDYPDGLCKSCEPIYDEYQIKIDDLADKIEALWEECEKKCRGKRVLKSFEERVVKSWKEN